MAKLIRVDAELVRRGLARSRSEAAELINAGRVLLDKNVVVKPSRQMDPAQALIVNDQDRDDYASRGAHKLIGALDYLGDAAPQVKGVRALMQAHPPVASPMCYFAVVLHQLWRLTSATANWLGASAKIRA